MPFTWREALIGAAAVFAAFLLVKMRPVGSSRAKLGDEIKAARDRAHKAKTQRDRAEALLETGELAAKAARWTAAAGFFLRAMLAEPAWGEPIARAVAAFAHKRPKLLEKILWRRLAHVPWDEAHADATRAAAEGLAQIYHRPLRDQARAEAMRKLARSLPSKTA